MTAWLSLPRVSGAPATCSLRLGPTPSPRSRSVVGQKQAWVPVVPSSLMSLSLRWVAWTALVIGPSTPCSASTSAGVREYAATHDWFSTSCSLRWTCSGRCPPAHSATTGSCSAGTARTECAAAPTTTPGSVTPEARSVARSAQAAASPSE